MSIGLVSIIIPTYNSSAYVVEALDSCLNQQYENLELVISDDKSTDNTVEIIQGWIETHKSSFVRVDFTIQEKNLGVRDNTNFLIKRAKGDYVRLLEGDDVLVEASIRKQVAFIKDNPEIKFTFSPILVFSGDVN